MSACLCGNPIQLQYGISLSPPPEPMQCTHAHKTDRFRLLQGVDLTGMELGSQRRAGGGAPLVNYVLDRCPELKRLRLQVCVSVCVAGGLCPLLKYVLEKSQVCFVGYVLLSATGACKRSIKKYTTLGPWRLLFWVEQRDRRVVPSQRKRRHQGGGACVVGVMVALSLLIVCFTGCFE